MLRIAGFVLLLLACPLSWVHARTWTDTTGNFKVEGTLISFNKQSVVIKVDPQDRLEGRELLAIPLRNLSKADRDYLSSQEALRHTQDINKPQTWNMIEGAKVTGKVVDFVRKDVTLQSRRGKFYVNDRPFSNLPEVYQKMLPRIVEKFEKTKFKSDDEFLAWVDKLDGKPKTYQCEGVILEFENGDEYAIPFFFFAPKELDLLRPGWMQWLASANNAEQQDQHRLYLQSQATAYQQMAEQQAVANQIAVMQLQLQAVQAGVTDVWEVYMSPPPGVYGYPISVVVYARNSSQASYEAMARNPGYVVGPIRRISR